MKKVILTPVLLATLFVTACGQAEGPDLQMKQSEQTARMQDRQLEQEVLRLTAETEESEEEQTEEDQSDESEKVEGTEEESVTAKSTDQDKSKKDNNEPEVKEEEKQPKEEELKEEKQSEPKEQEEPKEEQPEIKFQSFHHPRGQLAVDGGTGATVQNSTGNFTIHASLKNIQTLQSGPISVNLKSASKISGDITDPGLAGVAGDHVEYIQLDAVVTNSGSEPVTFHIDNTVFETGGITLYAHEMFSGAGKGYGNIQPQTEHHITLFYMLTGSGIALKDIYSIYGLTNAPTNQNTGAAVGESMRFNFSFTGA